MTKSRKRFTAFLSIAVLLGTVSASAQPAIVEQLSTIETKPPAGHGPTASEWSALANLPDRTGVWTPDIGDQLRQEKENNVPWTVEAAAEIQKQIALENAGKPHGTHNTCLPWGMPGFMMLTHNAMEFLFTPGRITIIGEADGNNLRRIFTDGRPHPAGREADPTFHGHSIGHWEEDTLVVDTDHVLPQTEIALSEGVGIRNGGGMHIVERIHKASSNVLVDDMEIVAPKILREPYKTRRLFFRVGWGPEWDIVQGVCLQGNFVDQVDANGYAIFVPIKPDAK